MKMKVIKKTMHVFQDIYHQINILLHFPVKFHSIFVDFYLPGLGNGFLHVMSKTEVTKKKNRQIGVDGDENLWHIKGCYQESKTTIY